MRVRTKHFTRQSISPDKAFYQTKHFAKRSISPEKAGKTAERTGEGMTEEFFIPDDQIRLHAKMDFPEGFEADSK